MIHTTATAEGEIPHLWHHQLNIYLPVRLKLRTTARGTMLDIATRAGAKLPIPQRIRGHLVYALPGGSSITESEL